MVKNRINLFINLMTFVFFIVVIKEAHTYFLLYSEAVNRHSGSFFLKLNLGFFANL